MYSTNLFSSASHPIPAVSIDIVSARLSGRVVVGSVVLVPAFVVFVLHFPGMRLCLCIAVPVCTEQGEEQFCFSVS